MTSHRLGRSVAYNAREAGQRQQPAQPARHRTPLIRSNPGPHTPFLIILYRPNGVGCPARVVPHKKLCRTGGPASCPALSCVVLRRPLCGSLLCRKRCPAVLRRPLCGSLVCRKGCPTSCPALPCAVLVALCAVAWCAGKGVLQAVLRCPALSCVVLCAVAWCAGKGVLQAFLRCPALSCVGLCAVAWCAGKRVQQAVLRG